MKPFHFKGVLSASKSILNRLLVIQSFSPSLEVVGESTADDVLKMKSALRQLLKGEPADCGSAGTTLRFLALRASRLPGTHHLSGSLRLFERPHEEISRLLAQLGCEAEIRLQRLTVRGTNWTHRVPEIVVDHSISSQFASALFLNAWNLPFDLRVKFEGVAVSEPYLQMTFELVKTAGMQLEITEPHVVVVKAGAQVSIQKLTAEIDVSSAFAVAALAAVSGGEAQIENWPQVGTRSLQPDAGFTNILARMGCRVQEAQTLLVNGPLNGALLAADCDLKECPDLFPVLAVLCAMADGTSRLFGAPHLAHKESDRIAKTAELVKALGRRARAIEGGLEIEGRSLLRAPFVRAIHFDTDHDHRLAMAAAVAKAAGAQIELTDRNVVTKSFPGFWEIFEKGFQ